MARSVDSGQYWTIGSPAVVDLAHRGAFALSLFGLGGAASVALDFLHLARLLGATVDPRVGHIYLAGVCVVGSVVGGALLGGLQWADVHTGGGEVN